MAASIFSDIMKGNRNVKKAHYDLLTSKYGQLLSLEAKSKYVTEIGDLFKPSFKTVPLFFATGDNWYSIDTGKSIYHCQKISTVEALGTGKQVMVATEDGSFEKFDGQEGLLFLVKYITVKI